MQTRCLLVARILSSFAVASLMLAGTAAHAQLKLNMANEYPAGSLVGQADSEFAKRVHEQTQGRVQIANQFGGAAGIKSADHFAAVEDGAVAIASTPTDKMLGVSPIFGLFSIPFLMPSNKDAKRLVDVAKGELEAAFAGANQVLLFSEPWTPSGVWANISLSGVDKLKELKLRTFDASSTITMKNAGVNAVQLTWGDVFPGLSTGMINSVLTSDEGGVSSKIWEHTKVFNAAGFGIGINMVHMNKDQLAKLTPADRQILLKVAAEVEAWAWQQGAERQQTNFKIMREQRVEVVDPLPADVMKRLKDAAAPIRAEWEAAFGKDKARAILRRYESGS
jgi:TRAP-type C4-dicarboxylate transport system substrate-binding protein